METLALGSSTLTVSRLAYGCMRISGTWNPDYLTDELKNRGKEALYAAYEAGYTLFDHADIYGRGTCESIHGELLKESPDLRDQTVIATKCGIRFPGDPEPSSPHRFDFSREHIVQSCEQSLNRLGVDCIDLYQLHRPDFLMQPEEMAEAFSNLYTQGKVKHFGVSNFSPSQFNLLQSALPNPLLVNQVEIHLGRLACFEDGTLDQCLQHRITPLAWSPLGGGWLGEGGTLPENKPHAAALLTRMDELADGYGVTRTEIALAWLLQHPSGIVPIVGSVRPERIMGAVHALSIDLGREEWYRLLVLARGENLP
jgi:predicted oxidoreductase